MFNKYLVVADHATDIRDNGAMAALLRGVDIKRSVVRSEGVMDVLDHATATNGFGGKLAIDLTRTEPKESITNEITCPKMEGVTEDRRLIKEWSTLLLFAPHDILLEESEQIEGVNFVAIFDSTATSMSDYDLLWLAAANSDPRRDVEITQNGTMIIDARSKQPKVEGHPSRFPNVVTATPETIELVDKRWSEYGLGERIDSPSRHYRQLLLSNKEDW